ncbi:hypothetical protein BU17DRAFT_88049 [Hysterangium stoloniferum]|nr:hypothetical protein BU17DRAFT_104280 [Hysterangium stoloniferum]KAF8521187.1 hypothetical protein BU17DRAFT_88049 [Hysterangium stoloniferum]
MPHALFLGSSLATLDRISTAQPTLPSPSVSELSRFQRVSSYIRHPFYLKTVTGGEDGPDQRTRHKYCQNNTLSFVHSHLGHGMADITMSLLGIAVPINSVILVLAGTVFFQASEDGDDGPSSAGLFEVHDLISTRLGKGPAVH